jgi:hypothetical protein
MFAAILVSIWTSTNVSSKGSYYLILAPVLAILLGCIARSFIAPSVEILDAALVYRTVGWTKTYQRTDIEEIGVEKRFNRAIRLWQPYIKLKSGKTIWLKDLSAGIRSQIGADDTYGDRMASMMAALQSWLKANA